MNENCDASAEGLGIGAIEAGPTLRAYQRLGTFPRLPNSEYGRQFSIKRKNTCV